VAQGGRRGAVTAAREPGAAALVPTAEVEGHLGVLDDGLRAEVPADGRLDRCADQQQLTMHAEQRSAVPGEGREAADVVRWAYRVSDPGQALDRVLSRIG